MRKQKGFHTIYSFRCVYASTHIYIHHTIFLACAIRDAQTKRLSHHILICVCICKHTYILYDMYMINVGVHVRSASKTSMLCVHTFRYDTWTYFCVCNASRHTCSAGKTSMSFKWCVCILSGTTRGLTYVCAHASRHTCSAGKTSMLMCAYFQMVCVQTFRYDMWTCLGPSCSANCCSSGRTR